MGADCCGGDSLPAAVHDIHLSVPQSNGKKEEPSAKTHEESAKELEGFIRKRIELFEQYATREAEAVRHLASCARLACHHMSPLLQHSIRCLHLDLSVEYQA